MFPAGGAIPFSGLDANIPRYADRFLSALEPSVRNQIRALFALFEHITIFIFDFFASRMVNHVALGDVWCCASDFGSSAREGEQSEYGFVDFGSIENTTT
jgi:hypothetical protein